MSVLFVFCLLGAKGGSRSVGGGLEGLVLLNDWSDSLVIRFFIKYFESTFST